MISIIMSLYIIYRIEKSSPLEIYNNMNLNKSAAYLLTIENLIKNCAKQKFLHYNTTYRSSNTFTLVTLHKSWVCSCVFCSVIKVNLTPK